MHETNSKCRNRCIKREKHCLCHDTSNTIIKESFEVLHTVEEMSMLADYIGSLDGEIRIVMESTGHYHLPVAQFCIKRLFCMC